ncbi:MAG: hypothetical protein L6R39_004741 [Caloplaca ligustica]|nr:MAG: hypothetical protein L6R39_004741 [Caloplaca ligustica]
MLNDSYQPGNFALWVVLPNVNRARTAVSRDEEVPRPPNLSAGDKADVDNWWAEEGSTFGRATIRDPYTEFQAVRMVEEHIEETVIDEWEDGKYEGRGNTDPAVLTPHVNRTVERLLQEYITDDMERFTAGNVRLEAKNEYIRGYKELYVRMWLGAHQYQANDALKRYIHDLWLLGVTSGR